MLQTIVEILSRLTSERNWATTYREMLPIPVALLLYIPRIVIPGYVLNNTTNTYIFTTRQTLNRTYMYNTKTNGKSNEKLGIVQKRIRQTTRFGKTVVKNLRIPMNSRHMRHSDIVLYLDSK